MNAGCKDGRACLGYSCFRDEVHRVGVPGRAEGIDVNLGDVHGDAPLHLAVALVRGVSAALRW